MKGLDTILIRFIKFSISANMIVEHLQTNFKYKSVEFKDSRFDDLTRKSNKNE